MEERDKQAKAVLILDMPKDCWECPCNWGDVMCNMEKGFKHDLPDKGRMENCPLRPYKDYIPKKWIKNYASHKASKDFIDCYWHFWEDDVLEMIKEWEEENEGNSNT